MHVTHNLNEDQNECRIRHLWVFLWFRFGLKIYTDCYRTVTSIVTHSIILTGHYWLMRITLAVYCCCDWWMTMKVLLRCTWQLAYQICDYFSRKRNTVFFWGVPKRYYLLSLRAWPFHSKSLLPYQMLLVFRIHYRMGKASTSTKKWIRTAKT